MIIRRSLLWGLIGLIVIAGGGLVVWPVIGGRLARTFFPVITSNPPEAVLEKLEIYGQVPDFSLTERSGRRITLADLAGKVWIANFFYTECTDTCPLQSATMARLQAELAEDRDVQLVSISVDPEHDTPQVLSKYAARFRADPERWLFLTGSRDTIHRLAIEGFRLGVVDQNKKAQPIIHSSRFVLVDRSARIRAYHLPDDAQSLERLRQNVRLLLREKPEER